MRNLFARLKLIYGTMLLISSSSEVVARSLAQEKSENSSGITSHRKLAEEVIHSRTIKVAIIDSKLKHSPMNKDAIVMTNRPYSKKDFLQKSYENHGQFVTNILTESADRESQLIYRPEIYFFGSIGTEDSFQAELSGIRRAIANNVKIINLSLTGEDFSKEEYNLLKLASDKGILVVVVAGNERTKLNWLLPTSFPCLNRIKNLICVGSATEDGIQYFSNYGDGVHIYTNGTYGTGNGTSFSAPRISRALAIAMNNYNITPDKAMRFLYASSDELKTDKGTIRLFNENSFFQKVSASFKTSN